MRRLKEGAEGEDLTGYVTELFSAWVGSECEVVISIGTAFRNGSLKTTNKYPRDSLLKFLSWVIKAKVLEIHADLLESDTGESGLQIFSDLSPIMLKKRRYFKFLTSVLASLKMKYHWGFPFRLIVFLNSKTVVLCTYQEAMIF